MKLRFGFKTPYGVTFSGTASRASRACGWSCFKTPYGVNVLRNVKKYLLRQRASSSFQDALRRDVLRNTVLRLGNHRCGTEAFQDALRRDVLRNNRAMATQLACEQFQDALRRDVLRNDPAKTFGKCRDCCFKTPYGVTFSGTSSVNDDGTVTTFGFQDALRRDVLRNRDWSYARRGIPGCVSRRPTA